MNPKIIILGPNSGIGKVILAKLKKIFNNFKFIIVVRKEPLNADEIFWDYRSDLPECFRAAFLVINCARSDDYNHNIRFNKILNSQLSQETNFINFSSNCVFAKPSNYLSKLIFKGDAYIREKLLIEKISRNRLKNFILRPTIVTGESSWKEFKINIENARYVSAPKFNRSSKLKVITTEEVADFIVELIQSDFKKIIPKEMFTKKINTMDFIANEIHETKSRNIYFDNIIKNLITVFLTSIFLPNNIVFSLQKRIIKKSNPNTQNLSHNKEFKIQGMTRLYLFGGHTL